MAAPPRGLAMGLRNIVWADHRAPRMMQLLLLALLVLGMLHPEHHI